MKAMYKKGGKTPKSFIEESSKELKFGGMDYKDGGFDLNKDGKITKADILKGRGVIKKMGGSTKKK